MVLGGRRKELLVRSLSTGFRGLENPKTCRHIKCHEEGTQLSTVSALPYRVVQMLAAPPIRLYIYFRTDSDKNRFATVAS